MRTGEDRPECLGEIERVDCGRVAGWFVTAFRQTRAARCGLVGAECVGLRERVGEGVAAIALSGRVRFGGFILEGGEAAEPVVEHAGLVQSVEPTCQATYSERTHRRG